MVPGGMGTFDVIMIVGLGSVGVPKEFAVAWLLFYRIFYYLVPFFTGVYSFIHQMGSKINTYLDGVPQKITEKSAHFILVAMVYFAGLMMILLSTVPNLSTLSQIFRKLLPFSFNFLDQTLNMLIGFVLLGLARGVAQRVKKAYIPTMLVLVFCIINTIAHTVSWKLILFYAFLMACLFWSRKEFYRKQLIFSWEAISIDSLLYGSLFILYSIVGYYSTDRLTHGEAPASFLLFPSEAIWFEGLIGLALASMAITILYKYLGGNELLGSPFDGVRYRKFMETYQGQTLGNLEQVEGNPLYFYQVENRDKVLFTPVKRGSQLVVTGDPQGDKGLFLEGTQALIKEADILGYQVLFNNISQEFAMLLHELGYKFMKTGVAGTVELTTLTIEEQAKYSQDNLNEKNSTSGYDVLTFSDTLPESVIKQLAKEDIFEPAIQQDGRSHAFDLREWLRLDGPVLVVQNKEKVIVALAGYVVNAKSHTLNVIGVYTSKDGPTDIIELVCLNIISQAIPLKMSKVDFGFLPFTNVGDYQLAFLKEKMSRTLYQYNSQSEGIRRKYTGLSCYINAFKPRYLSSPTNCLDLFLVVQLRKYYLKASSIKLTIYNKDK